MPPMMDNASYSIWASKLILIIQIEDYGIVNLLNGVAWAYALKIWCSYRLDNQFNISDKYVDKTITKPRTPN